MKYKRISLFLLTAMAGSIVFTGCEDPNPLHTVTFDSAGGSAVAEQTVKDGGTAVKPYEDPTRTGYVFDSWRLGSSADAYSFSTSVTAGITLTAKWLKKGSNDNGNGSENGNGSGNGNGNENTGPNPAVCSNIQNNYNSTKRKRDEAQRKYDESVNAGSIYASSYAMQISTYNNIMANFQKMARENGCSLSL